MRAMKIPCKLVFLFFFHFAAAQTELKVLGERDGQWLQYTDAPNALYHHLVAEAYSHLDERSESVNAISSLSGWQKRQQWIKQKLLELTGPFPDKTPLNPRVTRVVN